MICARINETLRAGERTEPSGMPWRKLAWKLPESSSTAYVNLKPYSNISWSSSKGARSSCLPSSCTGRPFGACRHCSQTEQVRAQQVSEMGCFAAQCSRAFSMNLSAHQEVFAFFFPWFKLQFQSVHSSELTDTKSSSWTVRQS